MDVSVILFYQFARREGKIKYKAGFTLEHVLLRIWVDFWQLRETVAFETYLKTYNVTFNSTFLRLRL